MIEPVLKNKPTWVTAEMVADWNKNFSEAWYVTETQFDEFGQRHKMSADQVQEMIDGYRRAGRYVSKDRKAPPSTHTCPNCGVKMVEESK